MKRVLKIVLPLLLAAVILLTSAWYFLRFRPEYLSAFLSGRAEKALQSGNYERAIQLYTTVERLSGQNPSLACALADAYACSGNDTRAEFTLVNAISAMPDAVSLYESLCRIYVRQGKLLDAEQMLNRISNETVREALDARRPGTPVFSAESGVYHDRIELGMQYEGEAAYLSVDGSYPCTAERYTAPVALPDGISEVCAISVSEDGLVSRAARGSYFIGQVISDVTFTDPVVEAWAHYILELDASETLTTGQLRDIRSLYLPEGVTSLEDLPYFENLAVLSVHNLNGVSFAPVQSLSQLKVLDLEGCSVTGRDLSAIGSLLTLEELYLPGCGISNISLLEPLTGLKVLDLTGNSIVSIASLHGMTELQTLLLGGNSISDGSGIGQFTKLVCLNLDHNPLSDSTVLDALSALRELHLSDCSITDSAFLSHMPSLETLDLSHNLLSDLSGLEACPLLSTLDATDNQITDIAVLTGLQKLRFLYVSQNLLTELPFFPSSSIVQQISANNNQITDVAGVCDLTRLNYLDLDYNQLSDISVLAHCTNLIRVNAFGNPLRDVQALLDCSILVNYDPTYSPPEEE